MNSRHSTIGARHNLRAVAFDLWETLITNTPEVTRSHAELRLARLTRILEERGVAAGAEQIAEAYRRQWQLCQERYWSVDRDVPCRRQIEHFVELLGAPSLDEPTLAALEEAWATAAVDVLPILVPGADVLVRDLKRRGLRLGIISNTGRTPGYALRMILERLQLAPFFDALVFSNEHGECKPRRSIFESLRRALDVKFEELLVVGDNLYVDVHGAQQCGALGVHFIPPVRGSAVAPPVEHDPAIEPYAAIRDLSELLPVIEAIPVSS